MEREWPDVCKGGGGDRGARFDALAISDRIGSGARRAGMRNDGKRGETTRIRSVVGGNSLQSTRSAFNNALPCTLGDLEREPITGEWNRMVFVVSVLSSP